MWYNISEIVLNEPISAEQIVRQVSYWLDLADYDMETGRAMLASRRLLYVTFMCHQVIEKSFKALYTARCQMMAPRIHALVALAQKSGVHKEMTSVQQYFIEALDPMNIECRYPVEKEKLLEALTVLDCERMIIETDSFSLVKAMQRAQEFHPFGVIAIVQTLDRRASPWANESQPFGLTQIV